MTELSRPTFIGLGPAGLIPPWRLRGALAAAVLLVAGCGGGGGDATNSTGLDTTPGATTGTSATPAATMEASPALAPSAVTPTEVATATAPSQCPQHFVAGSPPTLTRSSLQVLTRELCYDSFAVLHSGVSRTSLYAAEHLTREGVATAATLERVDRFHTESALPAEERAELADYARSGYDRGHLAPNADMPTPVAQAQSFTLANMVPQLHANNAGIWSGMEQAARRLATTEGEVYVVSGPAFLGNDVKQVGGRVLVPTHLWKVIYRPSTQQAGAYVIRNDDTMTYQIVSLTVLAQTAGVDVLPGLPAWAREIAMELPMPTSGATRVAQWP